MRYVVALTDSHGNIMSFLLYRNQPSLVDERGWVRRVVFEGSENVCCQVAVQLRKNLLGLTLTD